MDSSLRMMRLNALNEESDEDSESEKEEVTREALEEIALQQYAKTLELQKKGNFKDALKLLKDLLDTELLDEVEKPVERDNVSRPLLNLKYLCFKNVASISSQLGDKEAAIEAYLEATELDDTDITLWYRLGKLSLQCEKFELASFAFQRGVDCNPKHWPCIDNLITILLGLGKYNDCIINIYNALELDSDYYRGRVYRKHIFSNYPYVLDYLTLLNPIYKWSPADDENIKGERCDSLLKESEIISECYIKQINNSKVIEHLPVQTLRKPIKGFTWLDLGESLVDMHHFMSDSLISHACVVQIALPEKRENEDTAKVEVMEVDCVEVKASVDKIVEPSVVEQENKNDVEKSDDAKGNSESEKDQNEQEASSANEVNKSGCEGKDAKKAPTRRRGSSLSFLEQWEWCTKRRSSRKKTVNKQDRNDETIYDTLKRLLPSHLFSDDMKLDKQKEFKAEDSMDTMDIYKLFEEKEKKFQENVAVAENESDEDNKYFGTVREEEDVREFITRYIENQCDIITMIDEFVTFLSKMWKIQWPENVGGVYVKANKCSKQHFDPPMGLHNTDNQINKYIDVNLIHLEVTVGKLLTNTEDGPKEAIEIEILDLLRHICTSYEGSFKETFDIVMRYLWVRCHAHLYENQTEFALDCLYQMSYEFNRFYETDDVYILHVPNFKNKTVISRNVVVDLLKSLERNKQLATVLNLYEMGKFQEILPVLQDSFKNCQVQASKQEWSDMGLDWALYLVVLLETLWALEDVEQCFSWSVMCLHEGLKQFLLCTPGNDDYEKWSLVMTKILATVEHILNKEGSGYLELLSEKALVKLVQDLIQIIAHQFDDANTSEDLPLNTTVPWILLHHILQREEDCGRGVKKNPDDDPSEDVPSSIMILFTAHNYLGKRNWCTNNDSSLLYFILNTVIPRLRAPALSSAVETISQHLEQVVFCVFGHPSKKTKTRYLCDHNATPSKLDWSWAQNIFELYRPYEMPGFDSYKLGSITSETEQLFQRMLALMPSMCDPHPFVSEVVGFIENKRKDLPESNITFPYKIRDIYYLLADYYLKNNETNKAPKYYLYDIVINTHRFDSWAGIALARGSLLGTKLNSCETFKSEMEYLNRAAAIERCFKKALEIDSSHSMLWIEYGEFVYGVHSFCSRMLKQASESLSMENFGILEKRKNDMLDTAHTCYIKAHKEWKIEYESDDKSLQDERWLHYYMLGKISEKKSEPPCVYLGHYLKAGKYLSENNATYPSRINYNNPQNLSVEALEIHYRIHASILKYIEQHENKSIMMSVGKSFKHCLSECAAGPYSKKRQAKEMANEKETAAESTPAEPAEKSVVDHQTQQTEIAKRPLESVDGDESSCKKIKLSDAEKFSEDVDKAPSENSSNENTFRGFDKKEIFSGDMMETACEVVIGAEKDSNEGVEISLERGIMDITSSLQAIEHDQHMIVDNAIISANVDEEKNHVVPASTDSAMHEPPDESKLLVLEQVNHRKDENEKSIKSEPRRTSQESTTTNTGTSKEGSSSESSSDSSSDDSSSDSSSSSSSSDKTDVEKAETTEMSESDINNIISVCLDNLEDCVSRFPQHYKALYRLAHYYFYYKKDKNVDRCKELMLSSFAGRSNSRMQGLFCERKNSNFFNGIWRIPVGEVDRPGSFAFHMSRCVLITMEILKETDDHKMLLDLSLQLQKTPDAEKKYLRDAERIELSQQALSLCTRSMREILSKYCGKSNASLIAEEKKIISDFMLDVYKSYQKVQKHTPTKVQAFSSILVECYKLLSSAGPFSESMNLVDISVKHCQSLLVAMKQQANSFNSQQNYQQNSTPTPSNIQPKKPKIVEQSKVTLPAVTTSSSLPTHDLKQSFAKNTYAQNVNSFMPYLPVMDSFLAAMNNFDRAAATLQYASRFGNLANLSNAAAANSFSADLLQQFMATNIANTLAKMKSVNNQPTVAKTKTVDVSKNTKQHQTTGLKRQLSGSQPSSSKARPAIQRSNSYYNTFNTMPNTSLLKKAPVPSGDVAKTNMVVTTAPTTNSQNIFTISPSSAPVKPAHMMTSSSSSSSNVNSGAAKPAHMTSTSTVNAALLTKPPLPHQQVSPGKTLQEKLAERQKQNPNIAKTSPVGNKPTSPRSIACAAFSGKIPASLTITKSSTASKAPVMISGSSDSKAPTEESKKSRDVKKTTRFESDKTNKSKSVVDTSEIIILDDDDD